ncbi:GrpB family protein [Francisellaceae bacterium]|nr:GrpB family protein [Francisellaceae bacterium]
MKEAQIKLLEYDPNWTHLFNLEKERLYPVVKDYLAGGIEHVGSTAIPGMLAKPTIDIMVGVKSLNDSQSLISKLSVHCYCYYPYKTDVMHWFCKPSPLFRAYHLHLVPYQSQLWFERIKFRDYLIHNKESAQEYIHLKSELAIKYQDDREAYTQQKSSFIQNIVSLKNNAIP